jgi:cell division protein ZapA (FtsZ GTPase activity inhibitor)
MQEPPAKRQRRRKGEPLEATVNETIASLNEIRRVSNLIADFRRAEQDNLPLPPIEQFPKRKRHKVQTEWGEISEAEATASMKHASASMLAHAGFEGANEASLDLFTRMVAQNITNLGKTFRLLLDGFSGQMSAEEIMLHALHENGRNTDLEAHIRDDIEREGQRMAEMERKVKQAYEAVTTGPAIEDDMLLANDGEMLLDGNFADQLGEDFLGLLDTGIAAEHGLRSLTVPSSVFYKRRKGPAQVQEYVSVDLELTVVKAMHSNMSRPSPSSPSTRSPTPAICQVSCMPFSHNASNQGSVSPTILLSTRRTHRSAATATLPQSSTLHSQRKRLHQDQRLPKRRVWARAIGVSPVQILLTYSSTEQRGKSKTSECHYSSSSLINMTRPKVTMDMARLA